MATITITNLGFSGADLFIDAETYLHELSDTELDMTKGGCFPTPPIRTTPNTTLTFTTFTTIVTKVL